MTKSIETIWKSGFVEEDALLAPQINNLYERKSIHTIDRFKRMFKINLIAIVIGSFVPLIWAWVSGIPITGNRNFSFYSTIWLWLVIKKWRP